MSLVESADRADDDEALLPRGNGPRPHARESATAAGSRCRPPWCASAAAGASLLAIGILLGVAIVMAVRSSEGSGGGAGAGAGAGAACSGAQTHMQTLQTDAAGAAVSRSVVPFPASLSPRSRDPTAFAYEVSIGSIFARADPSLLEWIEYHLLIGVEHFWLWEHHRDGTIDADASSAVLLQPYIDLGLVTLEIVTGARDPMQSHAADEALRRARGVSRWLCLMDSDEFINLTPPHTQLLPLLHLYDAYAGVSLHWQMFGTSHHRSLLPGELLTQHLRWKSPVHYDENRVVKTLVQPLRIAQSQGPHTSHALPPWIIVNVAHEPKHEPGWWFRPIAVAPFSINHYFFRTELFFRQYKIAYRRDLNDEDALQRSRLNDLNAQLDLSIQRFVPELRRRLGMPKQTHAEWAAMDTTLNLPFAPYTPQEIERLMDPCPPMPAPGSGLPLPERACIDPEAPRLAPMWLATGNVTLTCRDMDPVVAFAANATGASATASAAAAAATAAATVLTILDTHFGDLASPLDPIAGMLTHAGCGGPVPAIHTHCNGRETCVIPPEMMYVPPECNGQAKLASARVLYGCKSPHEQTKQSTRV